MKRQTFNRIIPTIITLSLALLWGTPLARGQTFQSWPLPAGFYCYDALVQGGDGYLYGTSYNGGLYGYGEVFSIDAAGDFNYMYDFTGVLGDGANPGGPLMKAADGNLYGVTVLGGTGAGTMYKVDTTTTPATVTVLGSLSGLVGSNPYGGLVQGKDGYLYGASYHGGIFPGPDGGGYGTVYRTDTGLTNLTAMLQFSGTNALALPNANPGLADGMNPYYCDLIQATNGYFYGTTFAGGSNNLGTVFKMDANGVATTLVDFSGANGGSPFSGVIQAADGNLYGTTTAGGVGYGTIYRIGMDDSFTVLVQLSSSVNTVWGKLMQARDGLLYGTSTTGGSYGIGQVFAMDYAGNMTRVASFNGTTGYYPRNPVTQGADGNLYGLCVFSFSSTGGSYWQVTPTAPTVTLAACPVTNPSQVVVTYSQGVQAVTATNPANYSVNYGGPVVSVVRNSATAVTLQLSAALDPANVNVLTVNNVTSLIGAVPIAANSQATILVPTTPVRAQYNVGGTNFVVLEAEDYNLNTFNGTRSWVFTNWPVLLATTDLNTNYSGTGAMQGEPGIGTAVGATTSIGGAPGSPRLDYLVMFKTAGTNYVWVRGVGNSAPGAANADSVSIGLDGGLTTRIIGFPQGNGYCWTNGMVTTSPSTNVIVYTPGLHVINVWVRATGFAIDKLVLADSSSYTPPADLGPAESPIFRSTLVITPSGAQKILSWQGGGTLQWSANVEGPYQTVPGAISPYTVTLTGTAIFYRVKQ